MDISHVSLVMTHPMSVHNFIHVPLLHSVPYKMQNIFDANSPYYKVSGDLLTESKLMGLHSLDCVFIDFSQGTTQHQPSQYQPLTIITHHTTGIGLVIGDQQTHTGYKGTFFS